MNEDKIASFATELKAERKAKNGSKGSGCMKMLFALASFEQCDMSTANNLLVEWGHTIGKCNRPMHPLTAHLLYAHDTPVAVTVTATLIRQSVAQRRDLTRDNTIELARLCAADAVWCRVALRLWRECVFQQLPYQYAISYQDVALHSGNTYRFDGWTRIVERAASGTDTRSGRKGRVKAVWMWEKRAIHATAKTCENVTQ